jgi:hypothetical protein
MTTTPTAGRSHPPPSGRVTVVTCMKNEGPFILEWIAWNRMIGVTDFLIYTNDCTDGTDALLDALADHGMVHRLPNPAQPGEPYQMTALKHAPSHPAVQRADWVFVCDVDEFLNISAGDGSIAALIAACGNPLAISVSMRMMANGGVSDFVDRPVIGQFTRTHPPDRWGDETAIEVKTLTRADFPLRFFGAHRPFVSRHAPGTLHWTDGSGRQVPEAFLTVANRRRRHRFPAAGARALATLNHYTLRSLDSYLVKSERGDVNRVHRHFRLQYWVERNDDRIEEAPITAHLPALLTEIDTLKALPGVAAAHADCVARHQAAIVRLNADPVYAELRAELVEASVALGGSGRVAAPTAEPCDEEEDT